METMMINIENPQAKNLIYELVKLKLISINIPNPNKQDKFEQILDKFRNSGADTITDEEISNEVEIIRQAMYDAN